MRNARPLILGGEPCLADIKKFCRGKEDYDFFTCNYLIFQDFTKGYEHYCYLI